VTAGNKSEGVLIIAPKADMHAAVVGYWLAKLGVKYHQWDTESGFATSVTCKFGDGVESSVLVDGKNLSDFSIIWNRRFQNRAPDMRVPETDRKFVKTESSVFQKHAFEKYLYGKSNSINSPSVDERASNKFVQIELARLHGMRVPETLASNDPAEVRTFIARHGEVVTKPLVGHIWLNANGSRDIRPEVINKVDIGSDAELSVCGSIYQELIKKDSDIRAVYLDGEVISAEFISPIGSHIDYRLELAKEVLKSRPIKLPSNLIASFSAMCRELGVRFASADFAKCGDEFVFLDLNPKGQFLFVEVFNSDLPVLASFLRLLLSSGGIDVDQDDLSRISFADTPQSILDQKYHVRLPDHFVTIDEKIYEERPSKLIKEI
jgi:glutathione synthase/RimK-type ligase-like ATP-grasp enzyme